MESNIFCKPTATEWFLFSYCTEIQCERLNKKPMRKKWSKNVSVDRHITVMSEQINEKMYRVVPVTFF